jgi:hypothetical protein
VGEVCGGSSTGNAASVSSGGGSGLPFGSACYENYDCASLNCAYINYLDGFYCTVSCVDSYDCPSESSGCMSDGVCDPY